MVELESDLRMIFNLTVSRDPNFWKRVFPSSANESVYSSEVITEVGETQWRESKKWRKGQKKKASF